ncbi:MAG: cyclase family protein [Cyclobacteriaceae bacterium]|nr:cyclase family protein [Cyclobacteriaceae bacterium]
MATSKLIDLSHTIKDGMITYKGLPAPLVCDYLSHNNSKYLYEDAEFQIGKIEMIANTGTYIDCPFHRYKDGKDISETELEKFANLPGLTVSAHNENGIEIGVEYFEHVDVLGKAVLVHTDWSDHWQTDAYFENHPFLTEQAAKYLRDKGAKLVGIDSYNIDDTRTKRRPVHSILLGEEILIVEHLCNLKSIPKNTDFYFNAVPPKIKGMGAYPVRAYAQLM